MRRPTACGSSGGAHPTAIAERRTRDYAFVAMTNVDRIATVALGATPHVVGGTELRLFDKRPVRHAADGARAQPRRIALYVALTGLDAIAVIDARDPLHLHRLGLIPTGWAPSALALSADDRTLFVANQKGSATMRNFVGNPVTGADAGAVWSTLQRIDLAQRETGRHHARVHWPPRATSSRCRRRCRRRFNNVVLIVEDDKNYDEVLGDLGAGPGAPSFALYGAAVTPNLHALARRFGVGRQHVRGRRQRGRRASDRRRRHSRRRSPTAPPGVRIARRPLGFDNQDPEDAAASWARSFTNSRVTI